MEHIGNQLKGIYRDILQSADGSVIHDSGWVSNTIVERCRILLAGFMRNDPTDGIHHLAFGQGLATWDSAGVPAPDPTATGAGDPVQPAHCRGKSHHDLSGRRQQRGGGPDQQTADHGNPGAGLSRAAGAPDHLPAAGIRSVRQI